MYRALVLLDGSSSSPTRTTVRQNMHQFYRRWHAGGGDICVSDCATPASGSLPTVWKTILVGGLNNGGRGYYALDITDRRHRKACGNSPTPTSATATATR
jgi:hypothetical protein